MAQLIYSIEAFLVISILVYMGAHIYFDKKLGVPTAPSSPQAVKAILGFIPAGAGVNIVDMGSGWGGVAIDIARARPQCRVIGLEYSIFPLLIAKFRRQLRPSLKNLGFIREDFFKYSLRDTPFIVCYQLPAMMERLKGKFLAELPDNALILCNHYAIPGWEPEKIVDIDGLIDKRVFAYNITKLRPV